MKQTTLNFVPVRLPLLPQDSNSSVVKPPADAAKAELLALANAILDDSSIQESSRASLMGHVDRLGVLLDVKVRKVRLPWLPLRSRSC